MRPLQVWLPMLGPSPGFPDVRRDMQRAWEAWQDEQVVWLLPGLDRSMRWQEGAYGHLAIPAEHMDCVHIFHVGTSGHVYAPSSSHRFPECTINGLLEAWLAISKIGDVTFHMAPATLPWRVPRLENDNSIVYVDGTLRLQPGATVSLYGADPERRSFTIRWPPSGHPSTVSPDAESWGLHGPGAASPGLHVLMEWPGLLQPLGSLMGGLDDLYWQTKMAEIARSYSDDPDRAWQEATIAARQYMTQGYTTQLFAWVLPTLLADGVDGVLGEVERLCSLQPRSLDDVVGTHAWREFIAQPVRIRRAWGLVGLCWALLLESLETGYIQRCEGCGRILHGRRHKRFCGPEDDITCYRRRLAENRRQERTPRK
jgi:hypothetical protein